MRAVALLLVLALPAAAAAEPATVRVFEAVARAEPRPEAPAVHAFPEGAQVSVSEEAVAGWRRVRLPDGAVAWLPESALALGAPAAVPPPAAPPATTTIAVVPDLRPVVYVKDLDHLAELVREDAKVAPMAERLASRRRAAVGVGLAGFAISAGLIGYGASQFGAHSDLDDPDFGKPGGMKPFVGGMVGVGVSALLMFALAPKRDDLLDLVNAWNVGHPDRPFTIERELVGGRR